MTIARVSFSIDWHESSSTVRPILSTYYSSNEITVPRLLVLSGRTGTWEPIGIDDSERLALSSVDAIKQILVSQMSACKSITTEWSIDSDCCELPVEFVREPVIGYKVGVSLVQGSLHPLISTWVVERNTSGCCNSTFILRQVIATVSHFRYVGAVFYWDGKMVAGHAPVILTYESLLWRVTQLGRR